MKENIQNKASAQILHNGVSGKYNVSLFLILFVL